MDNVWFYIDNLFISLSFLCHIFMAANKEK